MGLRYRSMPQLVAFDQAPSSSLATQIAEVLDRGDAFCILDHRLSQAQRDEQLRILRPTVLVNASGETTTLTNGLEVEVGDALCCLTSGSSGTPKVAVLTLHALEASAQATSAALDVDTSSDAWLSCLPWAHIGGLSVALRSIITGTKLEVLPAFDAPAVAEIASSGKATLTSLVTTTLRRVDPTLFRSILLGGAAPPDDRPNNVIATYGMTETGSGVVYNGLPLPGVAIAVDQATGGLLIKSPTQLRAYRNAPNPFTTGPDGTPGWLITGDAGEIGAGGVVSVRGRLDEVIVTGGEKVHPVTVERALASAHGIDELCVWKRPDAAWGERVVAFVVPRPGADVSLASWSAELETLKPWERPKEIVLLAALPRLSSGKIARRQLS